MRRIKKKLLIFGLVFLTILGIVGVAYAGFTDKGSVLGSSFSVGSADIKIVSDNSATPEGANLLDEKNGPSFNNIGQNWFGDYPIKIYNNGSFDMQLTTHANYETVNDPDDLRMYIFAEIFDWNDENNNGVIEDTEIGQSYGKKTIIKWKTEGFDLGTFQMGKTKALLIRFSTESISDTKQGKSGSYDFEFDGIEL